MNARCASVVILTMLVILAAGCGPAATQAPAPPTLPTEVREEPQPEFTSKVDVGGYELYLHCVGTGTPTVVLEAGYDDVAETWSLVQPEVAKFARVCSYDRAGLGQSDPGPEPRNSLQIVKELRALLENAGIEGPYVLVGHSQGGMYARLFADCYQEDVVGLVLVDSSHIDQFWRNAMVLPTESPNESESLKFYREWFTNSPTDPTLPRRLFEAGSLGDMPLMVLTSPVKERPDDLPVGLSEKFDEIWVELQQEWAKISSQSTHIIAHGSGHFIQHDQPNLVISAILQVVEAARRQLNDGCGEHTATEAKGSGPSLPFACTSFAVYSDETLYGMNFDYPDVEIRFTITSSGDLQVFQMEFLQWSRRTVYTGAATS